MKTCKVLLSGMIGLLLFVCALSAQVRPGASMPYGFIGNWAPPASYGVLLSPRITVVQANWPAGILTGVSAYPQFASTVGQQIGASFFPWGTYMCPAGLTSGANGCGYLGNPYDPTGQSSGKYGKPVIVAAQVTAADNWQQTISNPLVAVAPPSNAVPSTAALLSQAVAALQQAITLLNKVAAQQ